MTYPQYNPKTGNHDEAPASGQGKNRKKYTIVRIRLAIKAARERGEEVNYVLVHTNEKYDFAPSYMVSGAKVISDYTTVQMGDFKLLK